MSYECSKKLLYLFNFVFWIGGAALVGFGLWMKLDPTLVNYLVVVNIRGTDPMLSYAAYIFIAAGGLALIIGFLGCCGAMRESQPLIFAVGTSRFSDMLYIYIYIYIYIACGMEENIQWHNNHVMRISFHSFYSVILMQYIVFLVLIMAAEIVGGVLALLYRGQIEAHLIKSMELQLKYDYSPGTKEMQAWDFLQQQHKCCGGNNSTDYKFSKWWNETRTYINQTKQLEVVPNSCCEPGSSILACQRDANLTFTGSKQFFGGGCYKVLEGWIKKHSLIMMILGLAIGGAQVFSFIAACCVRSAMKKPRDATQLS
ncbi:hypothetical protein LSH36_1264g00007 [Paralvinella palmiformis]|uniref:Tetraspanin n=1 Tax=Paralvinella palmiformis TaxID=53620 RepID=A0AAD9ITL6_9ANNE|nr:hypothetical protein LSH36_1264g00007 [Paralvinella palmiformis]